MFSREKLLVLFILGMALLLAGCASDDKGDLLEIESDIIFTYSEQFTSYEQGISPVPYLNMVTVKEYPMGNYCIDTEVIQQGDLIVVNLGGIIEPEIGTTVIAPASSSTSLPLNPGTYNLQFFYQSEVHARYQLVVTPNKLSLTPLHEDLVQTDSPVFYRYPKNSLAIYTYVDGTPQAKLDEMLAELQDVAGLSGYSFPDDGKAPFPDYLDGFNDIEFTRYYTYESDNVLESILYFFNGYEEVPSEGGYARVFVLTSKNEQFSWLNN